ncbi:MAG: selenide, water dikinase SelD [Candidatus Zixiibacteriota bacterium]|nr:MAG: selenide, water dikinase SelD [candidate division Zixibacteria bacterium]
MAQVLGDVGEQNFDNVLVGTKLYDDAGVVKVSDDLALVTTVDFFPPVVDDPYDFGAIAAANSLSDIYAMGAKPVSALNIVGFPEKNIEKSVLNEIIKGGLHTARRAGMPIVGGHTLKAPEPFYGLSITGSIHPYRILTNANAQKGDILYLTKPLGTGLITTAAKNGKAEEDIIRHAVAIMKELNKEASEAISVVCSINPSYNCAVTDITGYGLLGHLLEMLAASGKSAIVDYSKVPLMPGVIKLAKLDLFPGGSRANLQNAEADILWDGGFEQYEKLIISDAQTSGGLLISIKSELAQNLESEMNKRKQNFAVIGEVIEREKWLAKMVKS